VTVTESLEHLIEEIVTWPVGMPVRAMERVLALGAPAVPALLQALARGPDDRERDPLWLVVLLGEVGDAAAIEPLIGLMRRLEDHSLTLAAIEALAKIGPPAVPALLEAAHAPDPRLRLCAYAALGRIQDDRGHGALVQALGRDRELADVAARALSDQGRRDALPAVYEAYRTCEAAQRVEVEEALKDLHHGRQHTSSWGRDWRLRYRRQPGLGSFPPSWVWMALLAHGPAERRIERAAVPLRPLEEIVEEPPAPVEPAERCEECGAPVEHPTGVPVCPETALGTAMYQLRFLADARDDEIEDLFDLLDELDDQEWELLDRGDPRTPRARERWRDEQDELRLCRRTCEWLIEQGVETVSPARARLLAQAASLADRFGDPEGYLAPVQRPAARGPRVGRNDPCPCGSGRKYKRCCLDRDRQPPLR
jgi:hypothetical protein